MPSRTNTLLPVSPACQDPHHQGTRGLIGAFCKQQTPGRGVLLRSGSCPSFLLQQICVFCLIRASESRASTPASGPTCPENLGTERGLCVPSPLQHPPSVARPQFILSHMASNVDAVLMPMMFIITPFSYAFIFLSPFIAIMPFD